MSSWYESWHKQLTLDALVDLPQQSIHGSVMWVMLGDVADSVSYNKRLSAYTQNYLASSNVLYAASFCRAHILHNSIDRTAKTDDVIGEHAAT